MPRVCVCVGALGVPGATWFGEWEGGESGCVFWSGLGVFLGIRTGAGNGRFSLPPRPEEGRAGDHREAEGGSPH